MTAREVVVGKADDIAVGDRKVFEVDGRSIVIFRISDQEYYGLLNRCPHRGAELCAGRFTPTISSTGPGDFHFNPEEQLLACPWHGWEFDIKTGQSYFDPRNVRARTVQVAVKRGEGVLAELQSGGASLSHPSRGTFTEEGDSRCESRIPGPYKAETFTVSVADNYLVVDLRPQRPARRKE